VSLLGELYGHLPHWVQILDVIVLAIIVAQVVSLVTLLLAAGLFRLRRARERSRGLPVSDRDFLWVFLVPALDEEVTIADSVSRLAQTTAENALFLVIDDGSSDRTGEILAGIHDRRLHVLTRVPPDAHVGKAAALNAAYRHLRTRILTRRRYVRWDDDHVVVAVVDADGRLDPRAPSEVCADFADARVGGTQVLVRIYNRRGMLTWAQDIEFAAFGRIFQAGRARWGTANMGGNGQFTRLSALADVDDGSGPWRDRLTEDQDLGVRMIQAGWAGTQNNRTEIHQQGLNSVRRLYRQRVRWAQGNWQAIALLRGIWRGRMPLVGRIDAVFYLLTPLLQLLTGIAFIVSLIMLIFGESAYGAPYWWILVLFLALAFGPGIVTLMTRGGHWYTPLLAIVLVIPYTVYAWIIFPVLAVSLLRQLAGVRSWAKTARESLDEADDAVGPVA